MTDFTELMSSLTQGDDGWQVSVSDDWLQGRTLYGGLAAALCAQTALREIADLPPLRSAQFAFVGPASGTLHLKPSVLRKGKSTVFVAVDLIGDAGLATRATLCFGAARPSAFAHTEIGTPELKAPDSCPDFFRRAPPSLQFVQHFEGRHVGGSLPFSGSAHPEMTLWLRHRGSAATAPMVALLALADAPPPAASAMSTAPSPLSTMTWSIDMLTDKITTDDGWWLIRNTSEQIADGYSSQAMTLWNAHGVPVMASRQNIAVFG
ncbi:thioesterase family protein [Tardiphaga sp.]|jgi:acyl-CoA thioesterase|uniref:thioesterase family protein n=1 Tax=Tardiphaga sp. TaxID=1926292 RepID=UPI0019A5C651|nr:thioesterase family protein [Tardiphaga sp.]MBC7580740.1 thioesterase family protein [Tardiphaga sp.]